MLDTKNVGTTKIPKNCFEGKQLGVNPVDQPATTSEKAFENRYIDVGNLKTQEMNLKGGAKLKMSGGSKKRKNLYNLKELVSHCPTHLKHVNFYRYQNKYNSHGVSQKYSSEINKLLSDQGFRMKMKKQTLGGVSIQAIRSQKAGGDKCANGAAFRLDVGEDRIGGMAPVKSYGQCAGGSKNKKKNRQNDKKRGGGFRLTGEKIGGLSQVDGYDCQDKTTIMDKTLGSNVVGGGKNKNKNMKNNNKNSHKNNNNKHSKNKRGGGVRFDLRQDRIGGMAEVTGYTACKSDCQKNADYVSKGGELELNLANSGGKLRRKSKNNRKNRSNRRKHKNIVIHMSKKRHRDTIVVRK